MSQRVKGLTDVGGVAFPVGAAQGQGGVDEHTAGQVLAQHYLHWTKVGWRAQDLE